MLYWFLKVTKIQSLISFKKKKTQLTFLSGARNEIMFWILVTFPKYCRNWVLKILYSLSQQKVWLKVVSSKKLETIVFFYNSGVHVILSRFYPDFIQILSRLFLTFLESDFVLILSWFHPDFILIFEKVGKYTLSKYWFYLDFIQIKSG